VLFVGGLGSPDAILFPDIQSLVMLRLALSPPSSRLAFFNPSRRSLVANQASLGRKTSSLEVIAHRRLLLPCPLAIGLEGRALLSRKMTTRTDNARLTVATVGRLEGGKKIGDPKLPIKTRPDEFCRTEFHSESNPEAVVSDSQTGFWPRGKRN